MRSMLRAMAFAMLAGLTGGSTQAADLDVLRGPADVEEGVACDIWNWAPTIAPSWPSVWLGHFSGGRFETTVYGQPVLDWRNEKVCFPSRRACDRWIAANRSALHNPEGYWTCLPIR